MMHNNIFKILYEYYSYEYDFEGPPLFSGIIVYNEGETFKTK